MKIYPLLACLFLLFTQPAISQCPQRTSFVLSPTLYKYAGGNLGGGLEMGFMPMDAKGFVTLKSTLWTRSVSYQALNYKGEMDTYTDVANNAFVGLKYTYAPAAFEGLPRKWTAGAAAGVYLQSKAGSQPAVDLSTAYIIRMASGSYNGGIGYLKLEGSCLATPTAVKPGVGVGVFLLL